MAYGCHAGSCGIEIYLSLCSEGDLCEDLSGGLNEEFVGGDLNELVGSAIGSCSRRYRSRIRLRNVALRGVGGRPYGR